MTSYMPLDVSSASGRRPRRTACRLVARARVECISSLDAWNEGHMSPSCLRQAALPLHMPARVATNL